MGLLSFANAQSQPLSANAGPDKAWCDSWLTPNTDTPVLGGNPTAAGGAGPYTYEWSLSYRDFRGQLVTPWAGNWLDNYQAPNPKFKQHQGSIDSMQAVLTVADAAGATAQDTIWVYFQQIICTAAEERPAIKNPNDTIDLAITMGICISNFLPFQEYRWRPADYLTDSTVPDTRCFSPVSKTYELFMKDRIGCPVRLQKEVIVEPAGVTAVKDTQTPWITFDGLQKVIQIQFSQKGAFALLDLAGRVVLKQAISGNTRLNIPQNLPPGLYIGVLYNEQGHIVVREKIQL